MGRAQDTYEQHKGLVRKLALKYRRRYHLNHLYELDELITFAYDVIESIIVRIDNGKIKPKTSLKSLISSSIVNKFRDLVTKDARSPRVIEDLEQNVDDAILKRKFISFSEILLFIYDDITKEMNENQKTLLSYFMMEGFEPYQDIKEKFNFLDYVEVIETIRNEISGYDNETLSLIVTGDTRKELI